MRKISYGKESTEVQITQKIGKGDSYQKNEEIPRRKAHKNTLKLNLTITYVLLQTNLCILLKFVLHHFSSRIVTLFSYEIKIAHFIICYGRISIVADVCFKL